MVLKPGKPPHIAQEITIDELPEVSPGEGVVPVIQEGLECLGQKCPKCPLLDCNGTVGFRHDLCINYSQFYGEPGGAHGQKTTLDDAARDGHWLRRARNRAVR